MNDLVFARKDEAVTDSLTVAEYFQKRHDRVLRAIENLLEGLPKNGVSEMAHLGDYSMLRPLPT